MIDGATGIPRFRRDGPRLLRPAVATHIVAPTGLARADPTARFTANRRFVRQVDENPMRDPATRHGTPARRAPTDAARTPLAKNVAARLELQRFVPRLKAHCTHDGGVRAALGGGESRFHALDKLHGTQSG